MLCLTREVPADALDRLLRTNGIVVLDGGLGTELERRGADIGDPLWSARLLVDEPEAIIATHLAFFRAGAQVATSASYQASFEGFAARGINRPAAEALLRRSVELATEARRRYRTEVGVELDLLVAASVGPYGAMLADGSEYRGDYGLGLAELLDFHRDRLDVLASSGADLLAIETVPSLLEAEALVELLGTRPTARAWLSFSCRDGSHTRRGDPIEAAIDLAAASPGVVAVGINCTEPPFVAELIGRIAARTAKPIVVYPNGGERWNARGRSWSGPMADLSAGQVASWIDAGARIVGGCCRVGPGTIAAIAGIARSAPASRA